MTDKNQADNPLHGEAPAPDEFQDDSPEGREPNEMVHQELKPEWKDRPQQYPSADDNSLNNTDVPGGKS